ncbi:MAG: DHH family phosphoesterase [Candidatus Aenigmarchaeota archaeon]|nr:DHH family phosphoesterase [Candidatus Aenigmarchaeota archaeon]
MTGEKFFDYIRLAIEKLLKSKGKRIILVHHDDADGLASASILSASLQSEGFEVERICLEKLFPEVLERIHQETNSVIIYADIGSGQVERISSLNKRRNLTIILDHHDTKHVKDDSVLNVNPELFGFEGETDASGSVVSYLFAKALNKENEKLAYIALIGAQELPSKTSGRLTRIPFEDASKSGQIKQNKIVKLNISFSSAFRNLQILGPVGYYKNGPDIGVNACLEGFSDDVKKLIESLEEERKTKTKRVLGMLYRKGLNHTEHVQWFDVGNMFDGLGTKVIGTFCSYLSYQRIVDPKKYILGMMNVRKEIPGFGRLEKDYVKVSSRLPKLLRDEVERGKAKPLSYLLPASCEDVGGFGDGHKYAASGIFPSDKKGEFIQAFERRINE